jgi:phosphoesterase RecJ-like protein
MQNYDALLNLFNRYHEFALSTHINPDGDAIGSELGLYLFLTRLGIR